MTDIEEDYLPDTEIVFDSQTIVRGFVFTNNDAERVTITLKKNGKDVVPSFFLEPQANKIINIDLVVDEDDHLVWSSLPTEYAIDCVGYATTGWTE